MIRWSKAGVLDRLFERPQRQRLMRICIKALSLDSTHVKVHPDGMGALTKTGPYRSGEVGATGPPNFIELPRVPAALHAGA